MPTLSKTPSVRTFTEAWSKQFAEVVTKAAGKDGRLSASEAAKIAKLTDGASVFSDNAVNYLNAKGQKSVSVSKLITEASAFVAASAKTAAGADGRISAADQKKLSVDLMDDIKFLQGVSAPAPTPASSNFGATLTTLTNGMQNWSESESPVIPLLGGALGPTAPITSSLVATRFEALFQQHKAAMAGGERYSDSDPLAQQPVEERSQPAEFLTRRAEVHDVGDPMAEAYGAKWAALAQSFGQNLTDLHLFRFGTVEATYVLVGRTASGELAGIMTGAVET